MLKDLINYFAKKKDIKASKITREDYESAVRAMQSMEKDDLVEPGWKSYQKFGIIADQYRKQNPEEFH